MAGRGGHDDAVVAQRTDSLFEAINEEFGLLDKCPTCILGDINADVEDIPHLKAWCMIMDGRTAGVRPQYGEALQTSTLARPTKQHKPPGGISFLSMSLCSQRWQDFVLTTPMPSQLISLCNLGLDWGASPPRHTTASKQPVHQSRPNARLRKQSRTEVTSVKRT